MSAIGVTFYKIVCDWPGCKVSAHEHGDYAAWADVDQARMDVDYDCCGHKGTEWDSEEEWYCDAHPAVWASDHEKGEPFPDPPYLLIHDGDTDSMDDDGNVTLIEAAS